MVKEDYPHKESVMNISQWQESFTWALSPSTEAPAGPEWRAGLRGHQ